jgi:hypothetical protein
VLFGSHSSSIGPDPGGLVDSLFLGGQGFGPEPRDAASTTARRTTGVGSAWPRNIIAGSLGRLWGLISPGSGFDSRPRNHRKETRDAKHAVGTAHEVPPNDGRRPRQGTHQWVSRRSLGRSLARHDLRSVVILSSTETGSAQRTTSSSTAASCRLATRACTTIPERRSPGRASQLPCRVAKLVRHGALNPGSLVRVQPRQPDMKKGLWTDFPREVLPEAFCMVVGLPTHTSVTTGQCMIIARLNRLPC